MPDRRNQKNPDTEPETTGDRPRQDRRRPGRPRVHVEPWTKVTVVLFDRQIDFLDAIVSDIRKESGAAVSRAQLIRAFVDAVSEASLDLTATASERDVKTAVLARLGGSRPPS